MPGVADVLDLRAVRSMKLPGYGNLDGSAFSLGLPPFLPLARAASRPALVYSEMKVFSHSANIAMSWKNSVPI
jgi:hypothetical protein